ncbi:MAG TPA: SDR family NAD(P)-dependent oxidoreductase [Verrucomicrobiae bacterium]|nr:SDR family NAD(P)-dependent oxidoreductase [Verrucomicrobiae bacterium]
MMKSKNPVLITGGAGFIGTNVAHRLLSAGRRVIVYDNLSRQGVENNWAWLRETHGELVELEQADIRDAGRLKKIVRNVSQVFHFAAQVAVTTSFDDPIADFEVNARGTLNLLEAIRNATNPPPLIFTSTNKIYGDLNDVALKGEAQRYAPVEAEARAHGFSETRRINFHSPYGCSKGAACQYVLDYARTFKLPTAVFRMSCIYGPHQFGNEDQGWVAHFLIRAIENKPITIYGDGRQVRDILFIEDLVNAFLLAQENIATVSGEAFNIGGGSSNTISLLELLGLIKELEHQVPNVQFEQWRPADQLYYVSDVRKFAAATGWRPRVGVRDGIARLHEWLIENRQPAFTANGELAFSATGADPSVRAIAD